MPRPRRVSDSDIETIYQTVREFGGVSKACGITVRNKIGYYLSDVSIRTVYKEAEQKRLGSLPEPITKGATRVDPAKVEESQQTFEKANDNRSLLEKHQAYLNALMSRAEREVAALPPSQVPKDLSRALADTKLVLGMDDRILARGPVLKALIDLFERKGEDFDAFVEETIQILLDKLDVIDVKSLPAELSERAS